MLCFYWVLSIFNNCFCNINIQRSWIGQVPKTGLIWHHWWWSTILFPVSRLWQIDLFKFQQVTRLQRQIFEYKLYIKLSYRELSHVQEEWSHCITVTCTLQNMELRRMVSRNLICYFNTLCHKNKSQKRWKWQHFTLPFTCIYIPLQTFTEL